MAQPINIKLDTTKYRIPTDDDIKAAKQFILQREQYAGVLQQRIDDVIAVGAVRVVEICYKYDVDPKLLYFSSGFNQDMMSEISDVMDELEETILNLIYEYSTRVTDDRDRMSILAAWIALLGKGDRNLQDTLENYMYKMMKDWEAAIAAMRYAGLNVAQASTRIKTYLHQIYNMPEVRSAFKKWQEFTATYIRSRGIQYGAVGISNNGSTNVVNMAKHTLQLAWKHNQQLDFEEDDGITGFIVMRGSNYLCDLCDSYCGFHTLDEFDALPPRHYHCQCVAIPVYSINDVII
jgi:hypothetical protein